jgi:hypothetical protein
MSSNSTLRVLQAQLFRLLDFKLGILALSKFLRFHMFVAVFGRKVCSDGLNVFEDFKEVNDYGC